MLRELVLGCVGVTALAASFAAAAQAGAGEFDAVVERYVVEGLRSNLALQGESLEVERAAQALAAARARFLPEVSLQARYSRAAGGREFTIPLATTLNP
ncbi:MAG: TolC family protein, partial [Steroidobacteraceae bacterium]